MKISTQPEYRILTPEKLDGSLAMLKKAGFDGIDFTMEGILPYGDISNDRITDDQLLLQDAETIKAYFTNVKQLADKNGIEILQTHAPFPTGIYGNDALNAKLVKILENSIVATAILDCKYVVIHPAAIPMEEYASPERTTEFVIDFYKQFIPVAKENKVMILLENMFSAHRRKIIGAICSEFEETVKYIDALNEIAGEELFGFCYDTGHVHLLGKDFYRTVKQLGHRIKALHVHDNNGEVDQHVFPFTGISNWPRFIRALREIEYKGAFSFEAGNTTGVNFPDELKADAYTLLAKIGRYFVNEIEK